MKLFLFVMLIILLLYKKTIVKMTSETLIINVFETYINYLNQRFPIFKEYFLTVKQHHINGNDYIAYKMDTSYRLYNPDNGEYIGDFNTISNEINYINNVNNTKCCVNHPDNNDITNTKIFASEKTTCDFIFIFNILWDCQNSFDITNPDHRILTEIINETFRNIQNNYNKIYLKLLYIHKYGRGYNQSDESIAAEEFTVQDYEHFERHFNINDLNLSNKNIKLVIAYMSSMTYDNDEIEHIEDILELGTISTLK